MSTYNITAVRKTIGAIHHRMEEVTLDPVIRRRIIERQLADLLDTLPTRKFGGIVSRTMQAHNTGDTLEFVAGLALITSLLPPFTYGCALQGQFFTLIGEDAIWKKSKSGRVSAQSGVIHPHFPADTPVKLINE